MFTIPVVLVAFNRPDLTSRTLDAIRPVRPQELFLVVDGPRPDRPEDVERCAATRAVLDGVDWPCTVHRRFAEQNVGLEANVELGLDWVFSQVGEAIVLEDDCVPHPSFFRFAAELLDRYRHDERIWQISGSSMGVPRRLFGDDSYAFTAWASVWGWATWADRWQQHRAVFTRDHAGRGPGDPGALPVRTRPARQQPGLLVTRAGQRHFAEAAVSTDVVTHGWDKHWWLTMLSVGALAVSPAVNTVQNVGWGPDATHGVAAGRRDHAATEMQMPLRHPQHVHLNVEVERELELALNRVGGRAAMMARRLVKSQKLRDIARSTVNSRAAIGVARAASRLTDRSSRA